MFKLAIWVKAKEMKSTRIMNRRLSASKYLQRNISLGIEFWCWHCISISWTPSNRFSTMSFYSCCFPPEIKKQNCIYWVVQKNLKVTPSGNFNKAYEKDCHSSCTKCYIWGFHAKRNVSKPKPYMVPNSKNIILYKFQNTLFFFIAFLYVGANSFGTMLCLGNARF